MLSYNWIVGLNGFSSVVKCWAAALSGLFQRVAALRVKREASLLSVRKTNRRKQKAGRTGRKEGQKMQRLTKEEYILECVRKSDEEAEKQREAAKASRALWLRVSPEDQADEPASEAFRTYTDELRRQAVREEAERNYIGYLLSCQLKEEKAARQTEEEKDREERDRAFTRALVGNPGTRVTVTTDDGRREQSEASGGYASLVRDLFK